MTLMLGRVYAIALNTFREAIRNKVLYGVLGVVIGVNLFAMVLGQMSLHEEARVARDLGLAGVSFFGAITAIVLGVSLLYNEIQKKTIHTIITKPIERHEFVLGKYVGMAITLSFLVALFAVAMAGLLALQGLPFTGVLARAVVLAYMEVMVVAALAIFFSSFSTPYLSGIFTFAVFALGRCSSDMTYAADRARAEWIHVMARLGLYVVPDLNLYAVSGGEVDGKHVSVHATFVSWSYVGSSSLYALAWIGILLTLAAVIFRRRDFV